MTFAIFVLGWAAISLGILARTLKVGVGIRTVLEIMAGATFIWFVVLGMAQIMLWVLGWG